jgi:hypothetical protein
LAKQYAAHPGRHGYAAGIFWHLALDCVGENLEKLAETGAADVIEFGLPAMIVEGQTSAQAKLDG